MLISVQQKIDRTHCDWYLNRCTESFNELEEFRLSFAVRLLKGKRDAASLQATYQQLVSRLRLLELDEQKTTVQRARKLFPYAVKGCHCFDELRRSLDTIYQRLNAVLHDYDVDPCLAQQFATLNEEQQNIICRVLTENNCQGELETLIWCAETWDLESLQDPMPVLERLRQLHRLEVTRNQLQPLRQRLPLSILTEVLLERRPTQKLCRERLAALQQLNRQRQWAPFRLLQSNPALIDIVCFYPRLCRQLIDVKRSPLVLHVLVELACKCSRQPSLELERESALIRSLHVLDHSPLASTLVLINDPGLFVACSRHFTPQLPEDRLSFLVNLAIQAPRLAQLLFRLSSPVLFASFLLTRDVTSLKIDEAIQLLHQAGHQDEANSIDPQHPSQIMSRFENSGLNIDWLKRDCIVELLDLLELSGLRESCRKVLLDWAEYAQDSAVIYLSRIADAISIKLWIRIEKELPGALALMCEDEVGYRTGPSDWIAAKQNYGAAATLYLAKRYRTEPYVVIALGAAEPDAMITALIASDMQRGTADFISNFAFSSDGVVARKHKLRPAINISWQSQHEPLPPPDGPCLALGPLPANGTPAKFALAVARALLSQALDTRRLAQLTETEYYRSRKPDDHYRLYLEFLARKAPLLMRAVGIAAAAPTPLAGSRMDQLRPYANCTAGELAVAALLTEPRQGSLGSCFGTHLEINLRWSVVGLEHTASDYCELLATDALQRDGQRFPVYPSWLIEDSRFEACNLLARAREFAIGSMAGAGGREHRDLFTNNELALKQLFKKEPEPIITQLACLSSATQARCVKAVRRLAVKIFHQSVQEVWLNPPRLTGSWRLIRLADDVIINDANACRSLLCDVVNQAFCHYSKQQSEADRLHLDTLRGLYIDLLQEQAVREGQWDNPAGACSSRVLSTYFGMPITYDEREFHHPRPLMQALVDHATRIGQKEGLMPVGCPGHAMNLIARQLRGIDVDSMVEYLQRETRRVLDLPMSQDQVDQVAQKLAGQLQRAYQLIDFSELVSVRDYLTRLGSLNTLGFAQCEMDQLMRHVDEAILNSEQAIAIRAAWIFADTNWSGDAARCAVVWSPSCQDLRLLICSIASDGPWRLIPPGKSIARTRYWTLPHLHIVDHADTPSGMQPESKKLRV